MRLYSLLLLTCAILYGQTRELTVTRSSKMLYLVKNNYNSPATAWILHCQDADGQRWQWNDQDLGPEPKFIEPGKEIEVRIMPPMAAGPFGGKPTQCDNFQAIAAVFADGTIAGDPKWTDAITQERPKAYQDVARAKDILTKAMAEKSDPAEVQKQLQDWAESEVRHPGMARPSATLGVTSGWGGTADPPNRPFSKPAVPCGTLWLMEEQKKTLAETVEAMDAWSARLGELKAAREDGPIPAPIKGLQAKLAPPSDFIGKPAPEFTLKDVDGKEVSLKSLEGKVVLLNFWATWCHPCREEMPKIKEVYQEFKDQGLVVVSVNLQESAEKARKYFEEQKYPFVNLLDTDAAVSKKYGAGGIPRLVLVDKNGVVRAFQRGYGPGMDLHEMVRTGME